MHGIKQTLIGLLLAALSVVGFASTFVFGAELTKSCHVDPTVLSFLRFAIAGSVMLLLGCATARSRRKTFSVRPKDWLSLLWLGLVGTAIMAWCVFNGCARVSAANASMADALTPLMIFSVAALKNLRIERRDLLGLGFGFLGALLVIQVVTPRGLAIEAYSLGDVFILLAAATWGVYTVFGRELITRLGSSVFTAWTMALGAAALGLVLPFGDFAWPTTAKAWVLSAALGLVSTLLPFWAWNAAQKYLSMTVLGISAYFTPIVAVALACLFLHETATPLQWLGTVFVIVSAAVEVPRR